MFCFNIIPSTHHKCIPKGSSNWYNYHLTNLGRHFFVIQRFGIKKTNTLITVLQPYNSLPTLKYKITFYFDKS